MQVVRKEGPLRGPGLTFAQRMAYFTTLYGWFDSWRVLAYMLLAEKILTEEKRGEAYNFSSDVPLSVLEITEHVLRLMGRADLRPVILGENRGEIKDQWLSARKARAELDWTPQFTLDEGLRETIEWYRGYLAADPLASSRTASR